MAMAFITRLQGSRIPPTLPRRRSIHLIQLYRPLPLTPCIRHTRLHLTPPFQIRCPRSNRVPGDMNQRARRTQALCPTRQLNNTPFPSFQKLVPGGPLNVRFPDSLNSHPPHPCRVPWDPVCPCGEENTCELVQLPPRGLQTTDPKRMCQRPGIQKRHIEEHRRHSLITEPLGMNKACELDACECYRVPHCLQACKTRYWTKVSTTSRVAKC